MAWDQSNSKRESIHHSRIRTPKIKKVFFIQNAIVSTDICISDAGLNLINAFIMLSGVRASD